MTINANLSLIDEIPIVDGTPDLHIAEQFTKTTRRSLIVRKDIYFMPKEIAEQNVKTTSKGETTHVTTNDKVDRKLHAENRLNQSSHTVSEKPQLTTPTNKDKLQQTVKINNETKLCVHTSTKRVDKTSTNTEKFKQIVKTRNETKQSVQASTKKLDRTETTERSTQTAEKEVSKSFALGNIDFFNIRAHLDSPIKRMIARTDPDIPTEATTPGTTRFTFPPIPHSPGTLPPDQAMAPANATQSDTMRAAITALFQRLYVTTPCPREPWHDKFERPVDFWVPDKSTPKVSVITF